MTRSQTVFLILLLCLNQSKAGVSSNKRSTGNDFNSNSDETKSVQVRIGDSVILPCVFETEVDANRVLWLQGSRVIAFADSLKGKLTLFAKIFKREKTSFRNGSIIFS